MPRRADYNRPNNWQTTRARVLKEERHTCYLCGNEATEVDHITAVAFGGTHDRDNLTAICTPCHATKSEQERLAGIARAKTRPSQRGAPALREEHPNGPRS